MFLFENPVLQRELIVNLRMHRAFILLLGYLAALGAVVYVAWPVADRIDLSASGSGEARKLVDLFFVGQYLLASMLAPSFAAGTITGEKERKTYESLLASPLRPSAIIFGKLLASLTHLGILIACSLPIVMLCVPLGGISLYEVLASYVALVASVITFGMIGVACSSYFQRTMAALTVSYLIILPVALLGVFFWTSLADQGTFRLFLSVAVLPAICTVLFIVLFGHTARRLMHPPDVGSGGKDVVDLDTEQKKTVGMVIKGDRFPDKLFAPAKRNDLMPDGANPVYDKEMRSELFSQGTLMLRIVIQVSMIVALVPMAMCFYVWPQQAPWYIAYVILFNTLVGPVFSADRVTSERERETLELILTTTISPSQILWGKLISGLRVSTVLTSFLVWPVLLAAGMVTNYWGNLLTMVGYVLVIAMACVTTSVMALFCSVLFRKTSISIMSSYLAILILFMLPPAVNYFVDSYVVKPRVEQARQATLDVQSGTMEVGSQKRLLAAAESAVDLQRWTERLSVSSPFTAIWALPLDTADQTASVESQVPANTGDWWRFLGHVLFTIVFNGGLLLAIVWLFRSRWRVIF